MGIILINGLLGGFLDIVRGIEIWLTHRHIDHIDTFSTEFGAALRHGECLRRSHIKHTVGNL